jgi:hypothetical protein
MVFIGLLLCVGLQCYACEADCSGEDACLTCDGEVLRAKPNAMALAAAVLSMANELMAELPTLIDDVAQFPDTVKAEVIDLQNDMREAAKLVGDARQKKIQELFVQGVNLTILTTNILNRMFLIIAKIGPLAKAIDPKNGAKINSSMQMTAMLLQMISKINIAMKNSLIAEGKVEVAEQVKETPKIDPIPDL